MIQSLPASVQTFYPAIKPQIDRRLRAALEVSKAQAETWRARLNEARAWLQKVAGDKRVMSAQLGAKAMLARDTTAALDAMTEERDALKAERDGLCAELVGGGRGAGGPATGGGCKWYVRGGWVG